SSIRQRKLTRNSDRRLPLESVGSNREHALDTERQANRARSRHLVEVDERFARPNPAHIAGAPRPPSSACHIARGARYDRRPRSSVERKAVWQSLRGANRGAAEESAAGATKRATR